MEGYAGYEILNHKKGKNEKNERKIKISKLAKSAPEK